MKTRFILAAALALVAVGCQTSQEFKLIRPETKAQGGVSNAALYQKAGDADHVYMKSLDGKSFIQMPR